MMTDGTRWRAMARPASSGRAASSAGRRLRGGAGRAASRVLVTPRGIRTWLCAALWAAPAAASAGEVDMQALEALFGRVQAAVAAQRWEEARQGVAGYATAADFSAHAGGALAELLVPHDELLGAAEALLGRCVEANTLDNLALLGPANATELKRSMDFGWFHSTRALVHLKQGRLDRADSAMAAALSHLTGNAKPQPVDLLRAGLIDWQLGRLERGWARIGEAVVLDATVEGQDPYYPVALAAVVAARTGWGQTVDGYLAAWRRDHAPEAPDLAFATADGEHFTLRQRRGTALLVNFFSPACGSCQQEIPAVKALCDSVRARGDAEVLFVLNNPALAEGVPRLFARAGIESPAVVTLTAGSAYDHIPGEPTVWIVDPEGRIVARHTGYRPGDEAAYARELAAAAAPPRACDCPHR